MTRTLPRGACNAHCHVFGPMDRFPYQRVGHYGPDGDAPKEELYALNNRLGLQRCVVVQSVCHGFDNSVTEDAIQARSADYRGIALLRLDTPDAELRRLDRAGFRGVRFNLVSTLGSTPPLEDILAFGQRLASFGWHLQLHAGAASWASMGKALANSGVPLVIDHLGRLDPSDATGTPAFDAICRLLDTGRVWLKVSGIDRITRLGPPYADAIPLARLMVQRYTERVVWGNDWPHPHHPEPKVDDALLAAKIFDLVDGSKRALHQLMVSNPQQLYRF